MDLVAQRQSVTTPTAAHHTTATDATLNAWGRTVSWDLSDTTAPVAALMRLRSPYRLKINDVASQHRHAGQRRQRAEQVAAPTSDITLDISTPWILDIIQPNDNVTR